MNPEIPMCDPGSCWDKAFALVAQVSLVQTANDEIVVN